MKNETCVTKIFVTFADAGKKRTSKISFVDQFAKRLTIAHSKNVNSHAKQNF